MTPEEIHTNAYRRKRAGDLIDKLPECSTRWPNLGVLAVANREIGHYWFDRPDDKRWLNGGRVFIGKKHEEFSQHSSDFWTVAICTARGELIQVHTFTGDPGTAGPGHKAGHLASVLLQLMDAGPTTSVPARVARIDNLCTAIYGNACLLVDA